MSRDIDPLAALPRNVRDGRGQICGYYFPSANRLRMMDGTTVDVDSDGGFFEGRTRKFIDLVDFTVKH